MPQIQFIDRVDGVRDGVLLVLSSVVHSAFLVSLSWVRNAVALWRLVKEFHIFSTCCSRCLLGIWTLFLEPLVLAATRPCALRQSTAAFGRISSIFYVKVDSELPAQFSLGNLNIISTSSIWQFRVRQFTVLLGRISHIFNVTVDSDFPAQCALENLDIILLAVIWRWGGVFRRL